MRCYFKKAGRITGVEILTTTGKDEPIAEARALFTAKSQWGGADGFEVWDGARFLYCYPEETPLPLPAAMR